MKINKIRRKAQFFIITTVLISGALLFITDIFVSAGDTDYGMILERHDTDILKNVHEKSTEVWWDTQWAFRNYVAVEERNGSELSRHPIPVIIPTANRQLNRDCSDIRVIHDGKAVPWINTTACDIDTYEKSNDAVAWYKLDEASGPWANDSNNDHDGVLQNNPQWVSGRHGTALLFDGNDDYVSLPEDADLEPERITVTAWVYDNGNDGTRHRIVDYNDGGALGSGYRLSIDWQTSDALRFGISNGDEADREFVNTPYTGYANTWNHVAATYDGNTLILYLNGEQVDSRNVGYDIDYANIVDTSISHSTSPFNGRIDDVRIYNDALTSGQINGIYHNGVGLNVSLDLEPLKRTEGLYVYYGNVFATHPRYDQTDFNPTPLQAAPRVVDIGVDRTQGEIFNLLKRNIKVFDQELGSARNLEYIETSPGCGTIRLESPLTTLRKDLC